MFHGPRGWRGPFAFAVAGTADAAGLGAIEIEAMRDAGYDDRTTLGVTVGSALIGPIIPPSIPVILYAILAQVSAGERLLTGPVPGLLMSVAPMLMAAFFARTRKLPREPFFWASVRCGRPSSAPSPRS
ncbi:MAG: TRAP transporter large permease subunit [Pseudomonadota bacterium]